MKNDIRILSTKEIKQGDVELERGKESIHVGKLFKVLDVLGIDFELLAPEGV